MNVIIDDLDDEIILKARNGSTKALEKIIKHYQEWIYNIVLRMFFNPEDAQDITQEILIKILERIHQFKFKSKFKTWLFTIVKNYIFDLNKNRSERFVRSFVQYSKMLEEMPDQPLVHSKYSTAHQNLLFQETSISCLTGLLMCLNRKERLCFILGCIFGLNDSLGSEVLGIKKDNFRQRVKRSRDKVRNFMQKRCELFSSENPCKCRNKVKYLIEEGYIDPDHLSFSNKDFPKIKEVIRRKREKFISSKNPSVSQVYQNLPFAKSPDYIPAIRKYLSNPLTKELFEI